MPDLIDAARLLWCPGLAQTVGNPTDGLQAWLANTQFAPRAQGSQIILYGMGRSAFLSALAFDINKTAMATSETLLNISSIQGMPKSRGWPYIKLYYAALYSSHALQRSWGRSPSWITTQSLIPLRNLLRAYSIVAPWKLNTGQYILTAEPASEVSLCQDGGNGGSHDAIWRGLVSSLNDLHAAIDRSNFLKEERDQFKSQISAAVALITNGGAHNAWLSAMRNDIQYRQSEGVWYPYQGKGRSERLVQYASIILNEEISLEGVLSAGSSPLERFESACTFVILLARGVLKDISAVGGARSFVKYGFLRFEEAFSDP